MDNRKFGAITSSTDPEDIAARVKGGILAASSILILAAAYVFHITLTPDNIIQLATQSGIAAGAIWSLYGFGKWILASAFKNPEAQ